MQFSKREAKIALEYAKQKTANALPDKIPCGPVELPKEMLLGLVSMLIEEFVDALFEYRVDVVGGEETSIKIKVK